MGFRRVYPRSGPLSVSNVNIELWEYLPSGTLVVRNKRVITKQLYKHKSNLVFPLRMI